MTSRTTIASPPRGTAARVRGAVPLQPHDAAPPARSAAVPAGAAR
ncbi:hypothetical protein [Micromonospora sp. CPCC 205561]